MKKDGHFQVPIKKSDPIIYQEEGSLGAKPAVGGIPGRQGLKGAPQWWPPKSSGIWRTWKTRMLRCGEMISSAECGDCHPPTHPAVRGAGGGVRPRRNSRGGRGGRRWKAKSPRWRCGSQESAKVGPAAGANSGRQTPTRAGVLQGIAFKDLVAGRRPRRPSTKSQPSRAGEVAHASHRGGQSGTS